MTTPSEDSIAQSEAIAALAKHSWHINLGSINPNTPLSISYSFLTEKPAYYLSGFGAYVLETGHEITGINTNNPFKELSQAQKDVFNLARDAWAYVANITFTQTIGSIGQIAIANVILPGEQRGDTISVGYDVSNINESGDIFLQSAGGLG